MSENNYAGDLRELFTDESLTSSPVYIYCMAHPDTRRPSMAVYEDSAYCFTCGLWVSRRKLLAWVESEDPGLITAAKLHSTSRLRQRVRPQLRREEIETLARMAHENLTSNARCYFTERGLTSSTVERYQLGHYGAGYTLPIFDGEGRVQTIRFRRDDANALPKETTPKYWGLRGSNEVTVYPFPITEQARSIILTEGEFDALLLRQEGLDAYSLTNGARAWQKVKDFTLLIPRSTRIRLHYDNDTAGQEAMEQMQTELEAQGYSVERSRLYPSDDKDLTEMRQQHSERFFHLVSALTEWTHPTVTQTITQTVTQTEVYR